MRKTLAKKLRYHSQHVNGDQLRALLLEASEKLDTQEKTIEYQERELERLKRFLSLQKRLP